MASKIMFRSYKDASCSGSPMKTMGAMINPESYSRSQSISYSPVKTIGDSEEINNFSGFGENTFSLPKLLIDGTGVIPLEGADNVDDYLDQLATAVYKYNGDIHRPPFVKISWGTLTFIGICTSWTVTYLMFNTTGKALRATVEMQFKSTVDPNAKSAKSGKNSPDLTHARTVKAGDSLPLMTYRIYGDSSYYLEVARLNGLKNPNAIAPGDIIYFPPLKK